MTRVVPVKRPFPTNKADINISVRNCRERPKLIPLPLGATQRSPVSRWSATAVSEQLVLVQRSPKTTYQHNLT